MKKKTVLILLLSPVLLLAAAAALSYLCRQLDVRRAAESLRLLADTPPVQGEGGDALFLLEYDLADAATRRRWLADYGGNALLRGGEDLPPNVRAARLPDPGNSLSCMPRQEDPAVRRGCLKNVRAHLPAYQEAVRQHAKLLANADALSRYGNLDYAVGNMAEDALPPMQHLIRQNTAAAVEWAQGQHEAALSRACRSIQTGRTLMQGKTTLISTLTGNAAVGRHTELLAEMLAERPDFAHRLPENCTAALAPFAAGEPNICPAMKQEFLMQQALLRDLIAEAGQDESDDLLVWESPFLFGFFFSAEHSLALSAPTLAGPCTDAAIAALAQDAKPARPEPPPHGPSDYLFRPACWGNPIGCILTDTAAPEYTGYTERLQDTAMQQRAFQAALAVYRLPENQRRPRLNAILAEHSSPARQLSYDAAVKRIIFPRYSNRPNDPVRDIPLTLP